MKYCIPTTLSGLLLLAALTPAQAELTGAQRSSLTTSLFQDVAMPAQRALADNTNALAQSMNALCAAPDDSTLAAAQTAWKSTSNTWSRISPLRIGPNRQRDVTAIFEAAPVDESLLKKTISTTPDDPVSPKAVFESAQLPAGASGLPVLEKLLFADGRSSPLPALAQGKTCQFGRWVASGLARRGQTLIYEWNSLGEGIKYNPVYHTPFLTEALTNAARGARAIANHQLAAGEITPPPAFFPGWRAGTSKADVTASLDSIEYILLGSPSGLGFDDMLIAAQRQEVVDGLQEKLINTRLALTALPANFTAQPGANRGELVILQKRLNELADYIAGPMAEALGTPFKK
ncbi:putative lipoprotein [Silvimonas terrae]|uniref:Putative lipoprotein n=1 Tax=Silvimonas terrae TaxID=300266 RepID=A0A840REA3_9NEIS|nr:imelysin family protein [Silvimonas terrae]MBB5191317.1 putative lipoprotein [Silvimonas terrae]